MKDSDLTDDVRLRHMRDAAQKAIEFVEGETRETLNTDEKLVFALVRAIEIIGEAASRLTQQFRDANPQIPWRDIIGMRNRIVHAYFDVELNIVWDTVNSGLPLLIVELDKIIPPEE